MRFFLCLLILALLLPQTSFAAPQRVDSTATGPAKSLDTLFGRKKKIPPTTKQIEESFKIYDECKASDSINRFYDCECLSVNFLELRTQKPKDYIYDVSDIAKMKCANTVAIAGDAYQKCLGWAPQLRDDFEEYCSCYGKNYAKNFTKAPSDTIRGREGLMTASLNSCKTGREIEEARTRDRFIEALKKQKLYDFLFPAAKSDLPQPAGQASPP